jgi:predicted solute-binding protein
MTGLPFVFAVWTARKGVDVATLGEILATAKRAGMSKIDQIVRAHALPRGWPPEVAGKYLTKHLSYDIGPRELQAIAHFYRLAAEEGVIPHVRPIA